MSEDVRLSAREIPTVSTPSHTNPQEVESRATGTRTPRPYCHDGHDILQDGGEGFAALNAPSSEAVRIAVSGQGEANDLLHRRNGTASGTGSDSGTEADDERPHLIKALPAPHLRPRKGLKTGERDADVLLTPSQLDDDGRRLGQGYFKRSTLERTWSKEEHDAEQERLLKVRLAEFIRRSAEVALMAVIVLCVLCGAGVFRNAYEWRRELLAHVTIIILLVLAYPVKLSIVDGTSPHQRIWQRFRVPASFDPATVLYPTLLPILVALSLSPANPAAVLPNIVLGLSSLPQRLFPRSTRLGGFNIVHWFIAIVPLLVAERTAWPSLQQPYTGLSPETIVALYPLHHALLQPLQYMTTTSLLVSELHLLSAVLINLLLLVTSPQMVILKACLWIGGVCILVPAVPLLGWNVTLVRIPKWRLRRPTTRPSKPMSAVDAALHLFNLIRRSATRHDGDESDADEDAEPPSRHLHSDSRPKLRMHSFNFTASDKPVGPTPQSAIEPPAGANGSFPGADFRKRPRSNTLPLLGANLMAESQSNTRGRAKSPHIMWCMSLTHEQADSRKYIYAAILYFVVIAVILLPVRIYVAKAALHSHEPIGWALGYILGQIEEFRSIVQAVGLQNWIPLPPEPPGWQEIHIDPRLTVPLIRQAVGAANGRLLLIGFWAAVLLAGLIAVFSLTAFVEVDTRRKVFHGVMVAMMLPSTFVDPCACALALGLILVVFLLLEVIRAGQVAPLGNAISRFVAPYVDGRDLRGPIVVSHIFLLIGCAVPFWFSLASIPRSGGTPWAGWELEDEQREVAMVAGVICVGMGDAAASLIGRRYGRHKWMWVGGKSLEGSAAFAAAVTVGLILSKAWLVFGGWQASHGSVLHHHHGSLYAWAGTLAKAVFCACGASFMEAVLTGANDNVVVPVALWLLVKGVRL
ncbi:hypothetical protein BDY17DRAFT_300504 [Neohortaea acidophila]|uniref:dolichol kinase n=1 Tax=Neohortaea acidophila TaxID=245834 RepID=A0A6A6PLV7_9PEZI|nr:uncharacterized protein BDY17DRAFT_300504 [Neohortaea acidophila]KAF2480972.1 hypothetical protein BDY17DRAFT_300504 [Neohortaea acidophila]